MGDARDANDRMCSEIFFQSPNLAGSACTREFIAGQYTDTCGVIAPVFQCMQSCDQDGHDIALGCGGDNSTHGEILGFDLLEPWSGQCKARMIVPCRCAGQGGKWLAADQKWLECARQTIRGLGDALRLAIGCDFLIAAASVTPMHLDVSRWPLAAAFPCLICS